jgi:hypothetical protein
VIIATKLGRMFCGWMILSAVALFAQDTVLSIDEEPHYSRIFGNEFCKVYAISLDRLGEAKPMAHERNWVWMSLAGRVTEALGGTTFQSVGEPVGHEEGIRSISDIRLRRMHCGTITSIHTRGSWSS